MCVVTERKITCSCKISIYIYIVPDVTRLLDTQRSLIYGWWEVRFTDNARPSANQLGRSVFVTH